MVVLLKISRFRGNFVFHNGGYRQSQISTSENELQQLKRNKTAVKILNIILLIYGICMLPLSIYYLLLGAIMFDYKGNEDRSVYGIYSYISLPVFPCSGLNALAYMLKDKKIRIFYRRLLCCRDRKSMDDHQK